MSPQEPISPEFLAILRCPVSHRPLRVADAELLLRVNEQLAAGRLRNRLGERVERPLEGGLVTDDGAWLYPLEQGIPTLIGDEAVLISPPASSSPGAEDSP